MSIASPTPQGRHLRPGRAPARCRQCRTTVRAGLKRCPMCGERLSTTLAPPPGARTRLSSLQRRILVAVLTGGEPYHVAILPAEDVGEGEIKAGHQRIAGDAAIRAVEQLIERGDLEPDGDVARLTRAGRQTAAALATLP